MKKIITSLLLFLPVISFAKTYNVEVYCSNEKTVIGVLVEHGEKPMLTMNSFRDVRTGDKNRLGVLFVNPEKRTWTLIERINNDLFCIIGMGEMIKPFEDKVEEKKDDKKPNKVL